MRRLTKRELNYQHVGVAGLQHAKPHVRCNCMRCSCRVWILLRDGVICQRCRASCYANPESESRLTP